MLELRMSEVCLTIGYADDNYDRDGLNNRIMKQRDE